MGTPVAGPGQFSKRTDKAVGEANRSLPNADYGEQAQYQEQLQAAPMAQDVTGMNFNDLFGNPAERVTGLGEESTMPDVPVTDGAAIGPGAGLEAIGPVPSDPKLDQVKAWIPALEWMANQPNSGDSARNLLRQVKANFGM
jgi:hypothetical protein